MKNLARLALALPLILAACEPGAPTEPGGAGVSIFDTPPGPAWNGTATAVTVGDRANCVLVADGTPWCWGNTRGFGLRVDIGLRNVPPAVNAEIVIDSICIARRVSPSHYPPWPCNVFSPIRRTTKTFASIRLAMWDSPLCGVDGAAKMWCFDQMPFADTTPDSTNAGGLEYCGSTLCLFSPQAARSPQPISSIASGGTFCALTTAGVPRCVGSNYFNMFGNKPLNFLTDTFAPVLGAPLATAITTPPNGEYVCVLATTQKIWCWGESVYGAVGNGGFSVRVTAPTQVTSAQSFKAVGATLGSVCALTTAGAAYCWGDGRQGQIGWNGFGWSTTPAAVSGGKTFTQITAGPAHVCALDVAGAAWCWGDNQFGQLGVTPAPCGAGGICSSVPVAVQGGLTFSQISAGIAMTCGVTTTSQVYCWGSTNYGRLGLQLLSTTYIATPVHILP